MRRLWWVSLLVAALAIGSSVAAFAAHPTQMCLDLEQEHTYDTSNDDYMYRLLAYPGATDAGHPAEHDECVTELVEPGQDWEGTEIDFEIIEDDDGDTPEEPDMTCTVGEGQASCWVAPPSAEDGTQTIRGWIDLDQNGPEVEADRSEYPDDDADNLDGTDVVLWQWSTEGMTSASSVTIDYVRRIGGFRGRVTSNYGPCSADRTVKVFKRRTDGRRLIGTSETDENGSWRVTGLGNIRGRFYAVATRTTRNSASPGRDMTCLRDRSPAVRVP